MLHQIDHCDYRAHGIGDDAESAYVGHVLSRYHDLGAHLRGLGERLKSRRQLDPVFLVGRFDSVVERVALRGQLCFVTSYTQRGSVLQASDLNSEILATSLIMTHNVIR